MKDESINSLHSFLLIPFVIRERKQREGKNPPLQISKLPADLIRKLFSKKKKKKRNEGKNWIKFSISSPLGRNRGGGERGKCGNRSRRLVGRGKYGDDIVNEAMNKKPPRKTNKIGAQAFQHAWSPPRVNRTHE